MTAISHVFFDLHGTLIDSHALHPCYTAGLGELMVARYGGTAEMWATANRLIVADWDSYYADLDLGGEDAIEHMWEGLYRITRALFRLTGIPEPSKAEISALSREIPAIAPRKCDAFYDDTKPVLKHLYESGYVLGIASHALVEQARSLLIGGGVSDYFNGLILSPEVTDQFNKDATFFRYALNHHGNVLDPAVCLVVDDDAYALRGAKQLGMRTAHIVRKGTIHRSPADVTFTQGITGLDGWIFAQANP
ncbi:MAG: HAD family hydrolase [Aggregatilineales bacterium]